MRACSSYLSFFLAFARGGFFFFFWGYESLFFLSPSRESFDYIFHSFRQPILPFLPFFRDVMCIDDTREEKSSSFR